MHCNSILVSSAVIGIAASASFADPTQGNPNPWANLIGANDIFEGFESFTPHTSLAGSFMMTPELQCLDGFVSVNGQSSPAGGVWTSAHCYVGVLNNAVAQTGPNWNPSGTDDDRQGVGGGPDAAGERGQFLAIPRGTIDPQPFLQGTEFAAALRHAPIEPSGDRPMTIILDVYLDDLNTFVWLRPVSFVEGFILTSVFLGGVDFDGCSAITVPECLFERIVILGTNPDEPGGAAFFATVGDHRIREGEWFQIAIRTTVDSFSVWVRDSTTIGVNGFAQDSIYDTFPGNAARGAFAGEIVALDWLQVYPGVLDDPATALVEGQGPSLANDSVPATLITDVTGSPAAPTLFTSGVDGLQIVQGADPDAVSRPDYQPHDFYIDNYTVFAPDCVGDADMSGAIDGADLGVLLGAWGTPNPVADLNGDGTVDGADLGLLLSAWGPCE